MDHQFESAGLNANLGARMTIAQIARRLGKSRRAIYEMLASGVIPGIRHGHRWIVTRYAYERWEQSCGMRPLHATGADLFAGTIV
jgi:excisionase family DNA binding protein